MVNIRKAMRFLKCNKKKYILVFHERDNPVQLYYVASGEFTNKRSNATLFSIREIEALAGIIDFLGKSKHFFIEDTRP